MPLPSRDYAPSRSARRPRDARHRRERRPRSRPRARMRGAGRDRGAARTRRAQARGALRRDRRRRLSGADDPAARSRHRARPRISPTSPARCRRSTDASTPSSTPPCSWARWARSNIRRSTRWLATLAREPARPVRPDALACCRCCARRRTQASCSRWTRAAKIQRRIWGAYAVAKAGLSALLTILADEWENAPDAARQRHRARPDALAAARANASGRRQLAPAAAGGLRAALPVSARRAAEVRKRQGHRRAGVAARQSRPSRIKLRPIASATGRAAAARASV